MRKILLFTFIALFTSSMALAQALVPATSEDLAEFDSQLSHSQKSPAASQFGAKVSAEAQALQSSTVQKKKGTTLDARDKSQAGGNSASNAKDGKVSSPKSSDRGNSANAPGRNKTK